MKIGAGVAALALIASTTIAFGQTAAGGGTTNSNSMNPAARHAKPVSPEVGTNVPGATGVNPYTGKSVGVPLQPNDLGSPSQNKREP